MQIQRIDVKAVYQNTPKKNLEKKPSFGFVTHSNLAFDWANLQITRLSIESKLSATKRLGQLKEIVENHNTVYASLGEQEIYSVGLLPEKGFILNGVRCRTEKEIKDFLVELENHDNLRAYGA